MNYPMRLLVVLANVCVFGTSAHALAETPHYREIHRLSPGGEGGWDYLTVDADARRLYIARGDRIMVMDADSGQNVGEVAGLDGAHGIAWVRDHQRGFATSGKSGEIVAFDLKSLKVLGKVAVGEKPDAIVYDSSSHRVFSFNGKSRNATAVDPMTLKVVGQIALEGKPEFAVSDAHGHVFVNIEDTSELVTLDSNHLTVTSRHSLKPCESPTGLSIDPRSNRLIVGCGNKTALIVDAKSGKILQSFPVGEGVDATAFDAKHQLALVSAGEGRLTVLKEDKKGFHLEQDVPTVKSARTLAVDEKTGHVFLPLAKFEAQDPAAAKSNGVHARPKMIPGSFAVLVMGTEK